MYLPAVLQAAGLVPSAGQARRDIDAAASSSTARPSHPRPTTWTRGLKPGTVLQVGKRHFARLA